LVEERNLQSKGKILVCDLIHNKGIARLEQAGFTVDVNPTITSEKLRDRVVKYDALIVRSRTQVTKDIITAGKRLRVIGRAGMGVDNIDSVTAKERGIVVLNVQDAASNAVAELTIGLIIALARRIPYANQSLKEGKWIKKQLMGWELKDKTLGIVGLGNVGRRVARIAKTLGMKILCTKRTPPDPQLLRELEAEFVSLKELLRQSDVVTIHVPLTIDTHLLLRTEEIQLMKNGAFLINTARGEVIDEHALLDALKSGKLGGAALDVYHREPPVNLSLSKIANLIVTPHIGGQTDRAQKIIATSIANKVIDFLK
jgi:D-3-phosphoglycerate dehydrogenase